MLWPQLRITTLRSGVIAEQRLFALHHATRVATCLVETARLSNPVPPHKLELATDPRKSVPCTWISVPPKASADISKLAAVYWPNKAILAVCVPSLAVRVPPVSLLLVA